MTLPEYLLIVLHKLEMMEEMEKEREGIVEFDSLDELDAALSKLDSDLAKGPPNQPVS